MDNNRQSIKNWAIDDRPREKLSLKGAESLSNSELLAILINNGTKDKSAVELAKELLSKVDNDLQRMAKLSVKEMVNLKIKGLGPVKAVTIAAALELGVRRNMAQNMKKIVNYGHEIAAYLQAQFQYQKHEVFSVLYLNNANKINHYEIISEGGISGTIADPKIILRKALEHDATRIVLCHNHPSGSLKPSKQDIMLTAKIKQAAALFDINLMDHLIVSEEGHYSFADNGML